MIYPGNFEIKSGFISIRTALSRLCLIDYSRELVNSMAFCTDYDYLNKLLGQVSEMKYILQFIPDFPQQDYFDLTSELIRIRIKGTYLEPETLLELKLSLEAITAIISYTGNLDAGKFKELKLLLPYEKPEKAILEKVKLIVNEKGEIKDNASEALLLIRKEINKRVSSIDRRIGQILSQARKDNLVSDNAELAIRNGRLVIPMPAGNKRKLKGYVHDTSATGQTVFIEPAEVFEMNNDIQNLRVEEKQEIINILTWFTDYLRGFIDGLLAFYRFLGEIDFIRAKAMLSIDFQATKPELLKEPLIDWKNAIHPHLMKSLAKQSKTIVPQEIFLDKSNRIMIISGPNAGGKSVCLQTVALLQYMLQCGLLIPVNDDSRSGIFTNIFLEIGDEQSLENDLSTYSSHLIHVKHFLENADETTLFLIDEFGAGTEPQLGGAMAEASLQKLDELGSYGVVTTHYTNLKLMAGNNNGIFNAAMLYDSKAMRPLFKLSIGKPGSSFAFEIAQKIGFPYEVLSNATNKIGKGQLDFEKQLAQLEVDKKEIAEKIAGLKVADNMLAGLVQRYQQLLADLESKKHNVINDARLKARQIIDDSNKLIEKTIREIKEKKAEKEPTKQLREELSKSISLLLNQVEEENDSQKEEITANDTDTTGVEPGVKITAKIIAGSYVKMEDQESIGKVEEIKGNRVLVWFGSFKIRTSIDKLIPATAGEIKQYEYGIRFAGRGSSIIGDLNAKMADFKMSIDLRGKKPEQAREDLARYIDQAILLRVNEVRILHGKGNGILRTVVREYLNDTPEVTKIEDEALERGGHGITLVYLR